MTQRGIVRRRPQLRVLLADLADRGYFGEAISSLRLAAQDVALSRRKQGFESPRERQHFQHLTNQSVCECPGSVPAIIRAPFFCFAKIFCGKLAAIDRDEDEFARGGSHFLTALIV